MQKIWKILAKTRESDVLKALWVGDPSSQEQQEVPVLNFGS